MLSKQGFSPASVPSAGMYVQLRDSGQLHVGGDIIEAMGELKPAEIRRVRAVVAAVPGLRVAEATISVPRLEDDDPTRIFDINPMVRLDIYHRPWEGKPFDAAGAGFPGGDVAELAKFLESSPEKFHYDSAKWASDLS